MLKGAKKAIVRAPHRLAGSKSIEDRIIIEWSKDFSTAEHALDLLVSETKKFKESWADVCKSQVKMAKRFSELYEPIVEENAYHLTRETPESQVRAIQGYLAVTKEVENTIIPMIEEYEKPFIAKVKAAKECIEGVQKALKKREHKKVDFDRHSNTVEKLFKKNDGGDKEQAALAKAEAELDAATETFHAQDEKVKSTIPFVLTALSEFLNPLTSQLYLNQMKVYKTWNQILFKYCQVQGLTGGLTMADLNKVADIEYEKASYVDVLETWEERFLTIQPQAEQGLKVLRDGKVISQPLHHKEEHNKVAKLAEKTGDKTNELAHKAVGRNTSPSQIKFSSPQGLFQSEADLLAYITNTPTPPPLMHSPSMSSTTTSMSSPPGTADRGGSSGSRSPSATFYAAPHARVARSFSQRTALSETATLTTLGRVPVTSAFPGPPADAEQLRTRVRASMSTAARTLSPPGFVDEEALAAGGGDDYDNEQESRQSGDFISSKLRAQEQVLRGRSGSQVSRQSATTTIAAGVPARIPAGKGEHAVAQYTFAGSEPGDVAFRAGDRVKVLDHGDETDGEWWCGQTADGRVGLFPRTYVAIE